MPLMNKFLPKPQHIRVGEVFDSPNAFSNEVQMYCTRDAEAGMLLYQQYIKLPDLTARCKAEDIVAGMVVDVMLQARLSTKSIARAVVVQISGRVRHGGLHLSKIRFLLRVTEVANADGAAHFPLSESHRCACGQHEHGKIRNVCSIKCLRDFGEVPFTMIETCHRLRPVPGASVENEEESQPPEEEPELPEPAAAAPVVETVEDDKEEDSIDDTLPRGLIDDDNDSSVDSSESEFKGEMEPEMGDAGLSKEEIDALDATLDMADEELRYDDSFVSPQLEYEEEERNEDQQPTTSEQTAFLEGLDETIAKIINDANDLAEQGTPDELHQWIFSRVLGDGFHLMDRVKVPMRHDFKAAYFRALRAALFIHDSGDLERVKRVLQKKNQKLSHVLAWKYSYIEYRHPTSCMLE